MLKRRIVKGAMALLVTLGVIGATIIAAPTPASASTCPTNYLCLYEHYNYNGWEYWSAGRNDNACVNINSSFNDQASAARNEHTRAVRLFTGYNCVGDYKNLPANGGAANFQCPWSPSCYMNDKVSSWHWY